jgi:hypothetical protein
MFREYHVVQKRRAPITQVTWRNTPQGWKAQSHGDGSLKIRIPFLVIITVNATIHKFTKTDHRNITWKFIIRTVLKKRLAKVFNPQLHITEIVSHCFYLPVGSQSTGNNIFTLVWTCSGWGPISVNNTSTPPPPTTTWCDERPLFTTEEHCDDDGQVIREMRNDSFREW